ncbi:hypothetical protein HCH52_06655 [Oscillospiraceae bacterium HV4-5-C5C]|nr:hypothetical protein [Oscillospiraceae bacterium HV4-5-C5C]
MRNMDKSEQNPETPDRAAAGQVLTRAQAIKILELTGKPNREVIENRYAMLCRRYKDLSDPDNQRHMAEINQAYNVLTGFNQPFVPEDPRLNKKVAGKSVYQWRNIFYYGWKPALAVILVAALIIGIVYSAVTNKDSDFHLAALGAFYDTQSSLTSDETADYLDLSDYAKTQLGVENPSSEVLLISSSADAQLEQASIMKRMLYMSGSIDTDVFLVDQANLNLFAEQDLWTDMTDFYQTLQATFDSEQLQDFVPVYLQDETGQSYLAAINVSSQQLLNAFGILGGEQYLAISVLNKTPEKAEQFIKSLVEQEPMLLQHVGTKLETEPTEATDYSDESSQTESAAVTAGD